MATLPLPDGLAPSPFVPRTYRVARVRRENSDTWTLKLEPQSDANDAPAPVPGQFNMLYAFGVGEIPVSVSGISGGGELTHTVRAVGTVSRAICAAKRGTMLGVRGPFGSGWPLDATGGRDVVVITGGIGLAPLRPAIEALLARRREPGRVILIAGARTPTGLIYRREIERWSARAGVEVHLTVDSADVAWRGHVGVVTTLIPRLRIDPAASVAMICGPEVMMRYAVDELRQLGLAEEDIYISMERNMKCAVGLCGRCQFGPAFVCKDGPVFAYRDVARLLNVREA
jgi:NAD(P)H-flavin reductase